MSETKFRLIGERSKIFVGRRFQLRYAFLVAGSLGVLLLFTGFHGFFIAITSLPQDVLTKFKPILLSSTLRLFFVGTIYIGVVTIAALFLSHRSSGPMRRLESELDHMAKGNSEIKPFHLRKGDELEEFMKALNRLLGIVRRK